MESPMAEGFVPYCGVAPAPGQEVWNLDPHLLTGLLATLAAGVVLIGRVRERRGDLAFFVSGWLILALAFVSPLCSVSVALFSARTVQHMVLTLVAAPLVVRGLLGSLYGRQEIGGKIALIVVIAFTVVFWFWHSPSAYDETLENNLAYGLMHATLFGAALVLSVAVFRAPGRLAFSIVLAIGLQMSLLAALLTFATAPFYRVHELTTVAWGLTGLEDQQLGGLLMWIPSGLLLVLCSTVTLPPRRRGGETRFTI